MICFLLETEHLETEVLEDMTDREIMLPSKENGCPLDFPEVSPWLQLGSMCMIIVMKQTEVINGNLEKVRWVG